MNTKRMQAWSLAVGMLLAVAAPVWALDLPGYEMDAPPLPAGGFGSASVVAIADTTVSPPEQAPGGFVDVTVHLTVQEGHGLDTGALKLEIPSWGGQWEVVGALSILDADGEPVDMTKEYQFGRVALRRRLKLAESLVPGTPLEPAFSIPGFVACIMADGVCLAPSSLGGKLRMTVGSGAAIAVPAPKVVAAASDDDTFAGKGMFGALALAFLLGFGLLLTPCVYPLVPVTIALTGATAGRSKLSGLVHSFVYVTGICLTYSLAGLIAAFSGSSFDVLQHPAVSVVLAVVFVAMAAAMFDLFTVQVTSQRLGRLQAKLRGKGGLLGLFAVGVLSGVGVTACIAPVLVAGVVHVAARGQALYGFLFFFVMSWGFGLPLVLLGTFSGLLGSMPKPGEWMNTVKHFMGLALLAAALFYLGKSRVLGDFAFSAVVGGFLLVSAVFVGAFDSLSSDATRGVRARKAFGLLLLAAAVWSFVGLLPIGVAGTASAPAAQIDWRIVEPGQEAGLDAGGRPVLLDYWGEDCASCKKMLRTTFVDAQVVAESRRFVFAKIDMTEPARRGQGSTEWKAMLREHKTIGLPLIVLQDSSGNVVKRFKGYVGAEEMLAELRKVQ
jgi:thioredoxin:protein disulfide reductase